MLSNSSKPIVGRAAVQVDDDFDYVVIYSTAFEF